MTEPVKCGRPCGNNKTCRWSADSCPHHGKCEGKDMQREDHLSRLMQKGVCGVVNDKGKTCDRVRGECPYHAPDELRCVYCLDAEPDRRCSVRKENGSDYCGNHAASPNFGRILKDYAEECRSKGVPFCPEAFRKARCPPAAGLPLGNLHAIVDAFFPNKPHDAEIAGQPRPTSANLRPTSANLRSTSANLRPIYGQLPPNKRKQKERNLLRKLLG